MNRARSRLLSIRLESLIARRSAVPALIDTIEKDERLTRSVHAWRSFFKDRTVLSVRAAALEAVTNILKTHFFRTGVLGDSLGAGSDTREQIVTELRAYWKKYGKVPFAERMMTIITDPQSDAGAVHEAVYNLSHLGQKWRYSGVGMITFDVADDQFGWRKPVAPRPAETPEMRKLITQFSKPTVAEAILDAMDRELGRFDFRSFYQHAELTRIGIEDSYLNAIIRIGDRRVASDLINRYRTTNDPQMRRRWACAAHAIGSSEALKEYANELEHGKITLPPSGVTPEMEAKYPGDREHASDLVELRAIVRDLSVVPIPEVNRALEAMTAQNYPFYPLLLRQLLFTEYWHPGNEAWIAHPYCLKLLRRELDDTDLTGGEYRIDGDNLEHTPVIFGKSWGKIPALLSNSKSRLTEAKERRCDCAAEKLRNLVFGLPIYHPLQRSGSRIWKPCDEPSIVFMAAFGK